MNHRYDKNHRAEVYTLKPGEFLAVRNGPILVTVLGSCIATCLYDEKQGISGMNHFMLPRVLDPKDMLQSEIGRYGMFAMELLIGEMIKLGARRENLKAKIFGGASMIGQNGSSSVAISNIQFVKKYLSLEEIPIVAEDIGGKAGRKILFFTDRGKIYMKRLASEETIRIRGAEKQYSAQLKTTPEQPRLFLD